MAIFKKRLNRFYRWYIRGDYHCDKCPMCWDDYSAYLGDGDCGCWIKGDIQDTCRLLPPIRFLLGWPKMKRAQYAENHSYDGYAEFHEEDDRKRKAYRDSILILLRNAELCERDHEGKLVPMCKLDLLDLYEGYDGPFNKAYRSYDNSIFRSYPTLKSEWVQLLKRTWKELVVDRVMPYFE